MNLSTYLKQERGLGSALAAALGVSPVVVSQWANKRRPVPAEHCPGIERFTEAAVPCEVLRPDVDWAYLRGSDHPPARRIDTPEAAAAALAIEVGAPEAPPNEPEDPDAGRVAPAEETA